MGEDWVRFPLLQLSRAGTGQFVEMVERLAKPATLIRHVPAFSSRETRAYFCRGTRVSLRICRLTLRQQFGALQCAADGFMLSLCNG